jgi:hypothetical protein
MPARRILYHYTTQEGLLGIIKCRCLWTTNIFYLNDSTEFNYALELARGNLRERFGGPTVANQHDQFYADALLTLGRTLRFSGNEFLFQRARAGQYYNR